VASELYTVGHGRLTADDFVRVVTGVGIALVVDVRSQPGSRRHPQFGHDAMDSWLPEHGVAYRWEPGLGGRRRPRADTPHVALTEPAFRGYADYMETPAFRGALDRVLGDVDTLATAVMCAESVWWRCHRRFVADAAVLLYSRPVRHLFHDGRLAQHRPMEEARVQGDRLVYDSGTVTLPGSASH
jgi:uncharacterized protein (DUF488 family)